MKNEFEVGMDKLFAHEIELKTNRLTLNQIKEEDTENIFDIFRNPKVTEMTDFSTAPDMAWAKKITDYFINCYEDREQYRFAIREAISGKLIGSLGVFSISEDSKLAEIGFELNEKYWHKGYMIEAMQAFLDFYFNVLQGNRLEAVVTPGNDSSCTLLEKCGFVREGCYRKRDFIKGQYWDGVIYGILRDDRAVL